MRMEASPQMRIQLRKFAEGRMKSSGTYAREQFEASRASSGTTVGKRSAGPKSAAQFTLQDLDVSPDTDESFGAIAKRVLALLAAGILISSGLFFAGLGVLR